jgi:uroporphyrinogen-III synthase
MTQVLVTRPLEASQQLADQLLAEGLCPIVMPLYTFKARDPCGDYLSVLSARQKRRLAVFTSPRAVKFGLPHILADQFENLELAAIGQATRASLENAGYEVHLQSPSGYTSEDLLQLIQLSVDPGQAVIFCAPGGRETLAIGLTDLDWRVVNALVYERVPLKPEIEQVTAIRDSKDLLSIWTSISALKLARENLPQVVWEKILNAPALVISRRIQHHLQELGAHSVELADGPGNSGLLQSIKRFKSQRNTG